MRKRPCPSDATAASSDFSGFDRSACPTETLVQLIFLQEIAYINGPVTVKWRKTAKNAQKICVCRNTALRNHAKLPKLQLLMIISTVESGPREGPLFLYSGIPNSLEWEFRQAAMAELAEGKLHERFTRESGLAAQVAVLAEPVIEELGMRLVRVKISAQGGTTVQIMADRADSPITVEDCALISRRLSPLLDAHDPISGGYLLEVSSPGIDRPLVRPSDLEDWAGHEAKIEMKEMIDGRRRFRGILEGYEEGEARLRVELKDFDEPQVIGIPVMMIGEAKLVLTDDLLKLAQSAGVKGAEGDVGPDGEILE
jgi:ribosome maturation factor RimP